MIIVKEGVTVSSTCTCVGMVRWTFNNSDLPDNVKNLYGGVIQITRVNKQNEGFYECECLGVQEQVILGSTQNFIAKMPLTIRGQFFIHINCKLNILY